MKKIISITRSHNSSLCLLENGEITFHIENERLSKIKYDDYCFNAITHLPKYVSKVDTIALAGMAPAWKIDPKKNSHIIYCDQIFHLNKSFNVKTQIFDAWQTHHLQHAFCSFYNSGFKNSLCIVLDGCGSEITIDNNGKQFWYGREDLSTYVLEYPQKYELIKKRISYPDSLKERNWDHRLDVTNSVSEAKAFELLSNHFGWNKLDAGKVMGMATYGKEDKNIPPIYVEGNINQNLFVITSDLRNVYLNLKDYPYLDTKDFQIQANFAYKLQKETQEYVCEYIKKMIEKTGIKDVCLSGGYFLNCVANDYIRKSIPDINLYIEPLSSDTGVSMGLAKMLWHDKNNDSTIRKQKNIYYGFHYNYTLEDIKNEKWIKCSEEDVAKELNNQKIVALYQGRSEAGPRALGNRSILFDPRNKDGKDIVNKVKKREWFRPFAGTVLKEHANKYFDIKDSPFMMYACDVKTKDLPAITHIDGTCRVQTLEYEQNNTFYNLISEFHKITNCPVLFNTSFNIDGEPIVETLSDAINTFKRSSIDILYLPDLKVMIKKI